MTQVAKDKMTALGKRMGYSYDSMRNIAEKAVFNGSFCFGDDDEPERFYYIKHELFGLYTEITGREFNPDDVYFRCAC